MVKDFIKIEKDKVAIVVVGYNRLNGLIRLLQSLLAAEYPQIGIPLIISIDASENQEVYNYVKSFAWPFGEKYVNIETERLGLKKHIFQCCSLSECYKAVIILEDDLFVSKYFYQYALQTVDKYGDTDNIAEIALYRNETNGYVGLPFEPEYNGSDVFLMQDVCTWGEIFTEKMWHGFLEWMDKLLIDDVSFVDMPERIKGWTKAWSKYYNAYVVDTHKTVLYPYISLVTNFNDAGGVHGGGSNVVQVNILHGERKYLFDGIDKLVHYDIYMNNESIYEWLPIQYQGQVCLDMYGERLQYNGARYVISMRKLPFKTVFEWGLAMRPIELNIKYCIKGNGISMYDTSFKEKIKPGFNSNVAPYMLRGFPHKMLLKHVFLYYWQLFVKKIIQ